MIKRIVFLLSILVFIASSVDAQSRKEKKAAKAAAWQAEQKRKADEAALLYQLRQDSIKSAYEARKAEAEAKKAEAEAAKRKAEEDAARAEAGIRKNRIDQQIVNIPCMDDALSYGTDFLSAFGSSEKKRNPEVAIRLANEAATQELASRLVGTIKNGARSYVQDSATPSGQFEEDKLEGAAEAIGKKVINKLLEPSCREVAQSSGGGFNAYVCLKINKNAAKDEIIHEMELMKLKFDHQQMVDYMNSELEKQDKAATDEINKKIEALQ